MNNFILVFGIAFGLSMDAVAVSFSDILHYPNDYRRCYWQLPLAFGLFQGLMPVLGYAAASFFAVYFERFAGPLSFVILAWIGGRMLWSAFKKRRGEAADEVEATRLSLSTIVMQALATSIDALMVGVSFSLTGTPIVSAAITFLVTTAVLTLITVAVAKRFGHYLGVYAEFLGGAILILIGIKNLFG
ncbi:MAG: manganese efflux pump MntP family protein [Actinomycetes bacterium]|nr:manganese efflux pump MntP family protein [Actinomycetes bacterium]